mmetsp:Transcript_22791/g.52084  ORF Transcript_22791/g.52084 Transcript_22791/m.52084 type:complete len:1006 (+) Transcript_22791:93-3110(+)
MEEESGNGESGSNGDALTSLRERVAQVAYECLVVREQTWARMHDEVVSKLQHEIAELRYKLGQKEGEGNGRGLHIEPAPQQDISSMPSPNLALTASHKTGSASSLKAPGSKFFANQTLRIREGFGAELLQSHLSSKKNTLHHFTQALEGTNGNEVGTDAEKALTKTKNVPLKPDGLFHLVFEIMCCFVILHDCIMVPLIVSWDISTHAPIQVLMLVSLSIWTSDIVMNFMTGYSNKDGSVEMNRVKVCAHYLKTWCAVDMLIVTAEWTAFILELVEANTSSEGRSLVRLTKIGKLSRFLHVLVIMRLLRMSPRFTRGLTLSATWSIVPQIMRLLATILWINHVNGCVWYLIGRAGYYGDIHTDTGYNWLEQIVVEDGTEFAKAGFWFQYTTCVHWSITQMTPGSMEVTPKNSFERSWNVICLLFGLIFGSTLVGQLSSKMVQFNMSRRDELRRMEILRKFLRENNVDIVLSSRVQKHAQQRMSIKARFREEDVEDLQHLPAELRSRLRTQVYSQYYMRHPLFCAWNDYEANMVHATCAQGAFYYKALLPGHDLFSPEVAANDAFLSLTGTMRYYRMMSEQEIASQPQATTTLKEVSVSGNNWLAEVALWLQWKYIGTLQAEVGCEFVVVEHEQLVKVAKLHPLVIEATHGWCSAFQNILQEGDVDFEVEVNLPASTVIMHMAGELRLAVSQSSLGLIRSGIVSRVMGGAFTGLNGLRNSTSSTEGLENEINEGECILAVQASGEFMRTVPVVALKIRKGEGSEKYLVQLAKGSTKDDAQRGAWEPSLQLPGKKMRIGDDAVQAAQKAISDTFPDLSDFITLGRPTLKTEIKESKSYGGLQSEYLRTVFEAHFNLSEIPFTGASQLSLNSASELSQLEAHIRKNNKGRSFLYAWVTDAEFKKLQGSELSAELVGVNRMSGVPRSLTKEQGQNGGLRSAVQKVASDHRVHSTPSQVKESGFSAVGSESQLEQLSSCEAEQEPKTREVRDSSPLFRLGDTDSVTYLST